MLNSASSQANSSGHDESVTLRVMVTSDLHGELSGFNYFSKQPTTAGLVHTAVLINEARKQAEHSILIDNGDTIQGSPLASWAIEQLEQTPNPAVQALNALRFDVANIGNHEFNFGLEPLWQSYAIAEAQVISANIHNVDAQANIPSWIKPYAMIERSVSWQGQTKVLKIAVIGVLPPQIMSWDQQHLQGKIAVSDSVAAVAATLNQVYRDEAPDLVVLAAHMGMPKHSLQTSDAEQTLWEIAGLAGIDAIVFGHQHEVFPGTSVYDQLPEVDSKQGRIRGIPAVQPGAYGSHLGIIDLNLVFDERTGWQVSSSVVDARPTTTAKDPLIWELVEPAHEATLAYVQQPVGATAVTFSHQTARLEATAAMQFIHEAQLWYARNIQDPEFQQQLNSYPLLSAAAPFFTAVRESDESYTLIPPGAVTLGDIGDLYRYPNTLDVVKVNGADLRRWLEQSGAAFQQNKQGWEQINPLVPSYDFDNLFGLTYRYDLRQPVGQRVVELRYQGADVAAEQNFLVVTNNYRAGGGGDFAGLDGSQIIYRSPDMLQSVLINYLASLPEQTYQSELQRFWEIKN